MREWYQLEQSNNWQALGQQTSMSQRLQLNIDHNKVTRQPMEKPKIIRKKVKQVVAFNLLCAEEMAMATIRHRSL